MTFINNCNFFIYHRKVGSQTKIEDYRKIMINRETIREEIDYVKKY